MYLRLYLCTILYYCIICTSKFILTQVNIVYQQFLEIKKQIKLKLSVECSFSTFWFKILFIISKIKNKVLNNII